LLNEPLSTRPVRLVVWEVHWRSFDRQPPTRLPAGLYSIFVNFHLNTLKIYKHY